MASYLVSPLQRGATSYPPRGVRWQELPRKREGFPLEGGLYEPGGGAPAMRQDKPYVIDLKQPTIEALKPDRSGLAWLWGQGEESEWT